MNALANTREGTDGKLAAKRKHSGGVVATG
jgi:hypothetical protein